MISFYFVGNVAAVADPPVVPLRLTLDRPLDGASAPFAVAIARGLYREERLAVTTEAVSGSADALMRVASGATDVALADLNAFIRFRDRPEAVPAKALFILHDAVGYAIVARKSRGIATLGDLAGKTLGVAENDLAIRLWPALARHNGVNVQAVKTERIGAAVREPMLSAGQVDAVSGYSFLSAVNLRDRGIPADDLLVLRFADHGSAAYGLALVVNTNFAAAKSDAVRALLRAVTRAVQVTVRDPAAAIDDLMAQTSGLSRAIEAERLTVVLHDCIATPAARRDGIGMAEPARLERTIGEIAEDFKFRQRPLPSDIFEPAFLPPQSARRIDETVFAMNLARLYSRVLTLLGRESRLGWILAGANLLLASAQFAEPVLFGKIIDVLSGSAAATDAQSPWLLLAAWVAFGLFTIVCGAVVALNADRLAHRQRQAILTDYFEHIMQLPLTFHTGMHSGRLMKVMLQGTDALWRLWLGFFREHFASIVSLVVLLPLSFYINWRLAGLLFLLCVVFTVLTTLVVRKTYALQGEVEAHYSDLSARASDALGNVALVQSFVRIDAEVQGLRFVANKLLEVQMPVLSWWALVNVTTRASTTLTVLAIFTVGIVLHQKGLTTVGEIVMFVSFATLLIQRLEQVVSFINSVFMEAPRLQEFFTVFDTVPAVRDRPDALDPGRVQGLVEFDNVSFSYDGKRPAVADLSFTALPGQTIALVGGTGAGKSTAIALLHRAFDPQSGIIRIDGMDVRGMTLSALRRNIGVVFQEALLFDRTIAENLRVGKPDATEQEMRVAAERAQAIDFIDRAERKFDTQAGERGRMLSGGERQRLSIARALLKDPPILILDEATSALDAVTEEKVNAALDEVMKGRTTFVIAHRLATIRKATRILVFEQGRIVESGSFDELVAQHGHFAALAKAQFLIQPQAQVNMLTEP